MTKIIQNIFVISIIYNKMQYNAIQYYIHENAKLIRYTLQHFSVLTMTIIIIAYIDFTNNYNQKVNAM